MNGRSKIKAIAVAGAVASALLVAGPAQAALGTVNVTTYGLSGQDITGSVDGGASSSSGGGGIFTFTRGGGTPAGGTAPALVNDTDTVGTFIGICLEFTETAETDANYDLVFLDSAPISAGGFTPGGMGSIKANHLATLLQAVLPDFGNLSIIDTVQERAGLQIAVWEVVYEGITGPGESPPFYATGSGNARWTAPSGVGSAVSFADTYLGLLNTAITNNTLVTASTSRFRAIVNPETGRQDFVVQLTTDAPPPVPLPAAAWLLGSGLLGLFGLARRRQKTGEA